MNGTAGGARAVVAAFFAKLGSENDIDGWLDLIADDVVVDTPFSPAGQPVHFAGKPEIDARFGDARRPMQSLDFLDVEILATEDPERWVATCRSTGVQADGRTYANRYCWLFRIRNEKILWWCEYYDPQQVMPFLDNITMKR